MEFGVKIQEELETTDANGNVQRHKVRGNVNTDVRISYPNFIFHLQVALEKECPDIMKLGLLHVVGVRKATAKKQPAYLSFEHKSLQEFGASKFVTKRLETAENMKVSCR